MSSHAADGAALVTAAVQAVIQAGAPRRTVAVVAAVVAGTSLSAAARATSPVTKAKAQPPDPQSTAEEAGDSAQLLASLLAVRRAQRLRKNKDAVRPNKRSIRQFPWLPNRRQRLQGDTNIQNREQHHSGGHGGDMPCAAASGSQDAEASKAEIARVQIASEDPDFIMPVDPPTPEPQSDAEDPGNRRLPDSSCSDFMTERDRQVRDEALAAIAALPDLGGTQSQQQPESAEELFQIAAPKRCGRTAGRPNARAPTCGRR